MAKDKTEREDGGISTTRLPDGRHKVTVNVNVKIESIEEKEPSEEDLKKKYQSVLDLMTTVVSIGHEGRQYLLKLCKEAKEHDKTNKGV